MKLKHELSSLITWHSKEKSTSMLHIALQREQHGGVPYRVTSLIKHQHPTLVAYRDQGSAGSGQEDSRGYVLKSARYFGIEASVWRALS